MNRNILWVTSYVLGLSISVTNAQDNIPVKKKRLIEHDSFAQFLSWSVGPSVLGTLAGWHILRGHAWPSRAAHLIARVQNREGRDWGEAPTLQGTLKMTRIPPIRPHPLRISPPHFSKWLKLKPLYHVAICRTFHIQTIVLGMSPKHETHLDLVRLYGFFLLFYLQ